MQIVIQVLLIGIALFMIMLVLVQRGRGGGLAGALGGMGGQSAFGTKAGDMFTRITIVTAAVWILLCMYAVVYLNKQPSILPPGIKAPAASKTKPGTQGEAGSSATPTGEKSSDTKPAESKPAESSTPAESAPKTKSE